MNYLKLFAISILATLSLSIISCSDDSIPNITQEESKKQDIWVENGILHVNNKATLDSLVLSNAQKTKEELIEWQNKLGFENYQSFYKNVFEEYELMVEEALKKESDEPYFAFKAKHEEFVSFPTEPIEGAPNRTIEPLIKSKLNTVVNKTGDIYIGDEIVNYKETKSSLKSSKKFYCYKKTSKRKMKVTAYFGPGSNTTIYCGCKKKTLWAWWSYTTTFWCRPNTDGPWIKWRARDGDVYYPNLYNITYLEIFTDGVKSENKCMFSYY